SLGAGNEAEWEQQRAKRMQSMLSRLSGLIGMLEAQAQVEAKTLAPTSNPSADRRQLHSVFLVHGHNEAYTQETARFIENFGIKVIILKEQPNEGRTIIEKFEDHAGEAGFAVVLLTGDDVGGAKGSPVDKLKPRARQNVILELGYFLAKLKRK